MATGQAEYEVERFSVDIAEADLQDLRNRLRMTRWPIDVGNDDWRYGMPLSIMKPLVEYWADGYDWRAHERRMNKYEHFRVTIDGAPTHFMRVPGKGPDPKPVLLAHGWPWTFWDYADVLERLSDPAQFGGDPADALELIVPSLPGMGFSSPLTQTGLGAVGTAHLWRKLMRDVLGFERYGLVGGDFGAVISQRMAHEFSNELIGVHLTRYRRPATPGSIGQSTAVADDYAEDEAGDFERDKAGVGATISHLTVHTRDPQTLAYAFNDSPAGMAAWLWERRYHWSDNDGTLESAFSRDQLITTAMIYWFTETIGTSMRFYWETANERAPLPEGARITAPLGIGVLPADISALPRKHAEEDTNLQRWTRFPRGGHFGPAEIPDLFAGDVSAFFGPLH